jgi:predicted permease
MAARPMHERVYRALLRLLPSAFRQEFGTSMVEDFHDQRHEAAAQGRSRVHALWMNTISGLILLATRERLGAVSRDVRYALRLCRRRQAFTVTTVLTIATGIGVTTATFSVLQAIILQELPGPESDRLVAIYEVGPSPERPQGPVSNANFVDWKPQVTTLDGLALYNATTGLVQVDGTATERLTGLAVSDDFMLMTGLVPRLGRLFLPEDFDAWHAAYASNARSTPQPGVMVLSEGTWQRVFGGRVDIVGQTILLNDNPVEVIGVIADHPLLRIFSPTAAPEFWTPGGAWSMVVRRARLMASVGRLSPGTTLEQAQGELDVIAARLASAYPADNAGWTIRLVPLREAITARATTQLLLLFGASICVALIATLNVARLLATLNQGRRHEFLTRLALGASRHELSRQAITESLVLSAIGGGLGVLLAWLMLPVLVAMAPGDIPRLNEVAIHPQTMVFAFALTIAVGICCGVAAHLMTPHRLVTGPSSAGQRPGWGPKLMLAAQVAIALVLATGTAILVRSMQHVAAEPLGFSPENLVASTIALPRSASQNIVEAHSVVQRMIDRLELHPGVMAAASGPRPLGTGPSNVIRHKALTGEGVRMQVADVTPNYFLVVGARLTAGRGFSDSDTDSPAPVILNEQAARALSLQPGAVGQELVIDETPVIVVGIVDNIRQALESTPGPIVYAPAFRSRSTWSGQLLVRTHQSPEMILPDVRAIISEIDPRAALHRTQTMEQRMRELTTPRRFILRLVTMFSVLAIALAVIGLAGVVAESVSQRVREIGIRMALGARTGAIVSQMMHQGVRVVVVGAIAGVVIAYQLSTALEGFVYGVTTTDTWSFIVATGAVVVASLFACYLPARRATSIDPVIALRRE